MKCARLGVFELVKDPWKRMQSQCFYKDTVTLAMRVFFFLSFLDCHLSFNTLPQPQVKVTLLPGDTNLRPGDLPRVQKGQRLLWPHPAWEDTCAGRLDGVNSLGPACRTAQSVDGHFSPTIKEECIWRRKSNYINKQQHRSTYTKAHVHHFTKCCYAVIMATHL